MTDKKIIKKLAVERCRLHISHLCALQHLLKGVDEGDSGVFEPMHDLFESLNRDLGVIEALIVE